MSTNTTNSKTPESFERMISVPMSGDDYDICTPLLRQLANAEVIHAFIYEETISAATIYYTAKPEEENSPNDDNDVGQAEGTSAAQ